MTKFTKYADFLILGIITCFSLNSIYQHVVNYEIIDTQHYFSFFLLAIALLIRFFNPKKGKIILGILLAMGSLNLVNYTIDSYNILFSFSLNSLKLKTVGLQPISFVLFLFFILINYRSIKKLYHKLFDDSPEEKGAIVKAKTEKYESIFNKYSVEELEEIIKNRKEDYEPFARNIMYRILNEKKSIAK